MREIGVSVYSDFCSMEYITIYLSKASRLGFKKVFTSLILENHGFETLNKMEYHQLKELYNICHKLGLHITADINREVFEVSGCSLNKLKPLRDMCIERLRIDDGFSNAEICTLTNNDFGIKIELSAASAGKKGDYTYDETKELLELIKKEGTLKSLTACHNFYPLTGTGIDISEIRDVNKLFKSYDIPLGGFVASQFSPKHLHKNGNGVPTVEKHRYLPPHIAMQELFAEGFDYVLIGDSMAHDSELETMAKCAKSSTIEIPVVFNQYISDSIKEKILNMELKSRIDQPAEVIRASDSRGLEVAPIYCANRSKYTVTICNSNASHYMGELQISLTDIGPSIEHNVLGFVHQDAIGLLESIKYGRNKFKLVKY
ncbi:MupG family TIM beta-alpha barrel fold protein [Ruminiclostridium papyrosolvens]|uniref:Cell surface protein n=1 Tax=Ruminiclostridium papyrosolvens C7 TaxID=1330534 RepID=U4R608_9FIRM|nr:MupG family TIM beta-alpha barrel fold protein [Ruminiclostridium papyrosolvens]EPR14059.1 hypothetical protein L323_01585 [Ruminiclostridium papyrosolvens C7]